MSLLKKVLISSVSIVAVAGVATGIGVAINNSRHVEEMPDKGYEKPDTTPIPEMVNLQELVNSIKPENIVFKSTTTGVETTRKALTPAADNKTDGRDAIYAFDVTSQQLDLDEATKAKLTAKKVNVEIEITNLTNNGIALNDGKLSINLKAASSENKEGNDTASNSLELSGFKKTTDTLKAFFKTEQNTKATVIDLTKPAMPSMTSYLKVEDLNNKNVKVNGATRQSRRLTTPVAEDQEQMISGLTNLFRNVAVNENAMATKNNFTVEGEVKLEKITTNAEKESLFHLVSAENDKKLKLVETKDGMKNEALVDEIVVTNLLASDIKLNIKGIDKTLDETYTKKIIEDAQKNDSSTYKYKYAEGMGLSVQVGSSSMQSVSVVPTLVKRTEKEQKILANLVVSFGSGDNAKSYDTAKMEDLTALNNSGFSFGIYIKDLMKTDKVVKSEDVKSGNNKLETYLKADNFTKPVEKSMLNDSSSSMPMGGFKLIDLKVKEIKTDFEIGEAKTVKSVPGVPGVRAMDARDDRAEQLDVPQQDWENENWIGLISYSFGKEEATKTLFTPSISLIHIDASQPKIAAEHA